MASTNSILQRCAGLIDTTDVSERENGFLKSVWERSEQGKRPDKLSGPQLEWLTDIHEKHFEG